MKIGFVSTYPPRNCGIAVYADLLAKSLLQADSQVEICVLAEKGAQEQKDERFEVKVVYERNADYGPAIFQAARESGVDLLHFQCAPELFGEDGRLPALVARLKTSGCAVALTLHTVRGARWHRTLLLSRPTALFHRSLAENAALVVHHESNAEALRSQGIASSRVTVIPHGTSQMELVPRDHARRELELPVDGVIFLFFGFIHAQKNLHTVVEAFRRVQKEHRGIFLAIAGATQAGQWYNELYARWLRWRLGPGMAEGRVFWRQEFIRGDLVPAYYSAADVVLLPHAFQRYGSVSGIFHQALGAKRPIICSKSNKFKEAMDHLKDEPAVFVKPMDVSGWAAAIVKMAEDESFRRRVCAKLADYAQSTLWPAVARSHLALYQSLGSDRPRFP